MSNLKLGTKCVQGGYTPGNGEPRQVPIIQSTTFKYATSEDMGKLFDLEASGYFYSRLQNSQTQPCPGLHPSALRFVHAYLAAYRPYFASISCFFMCPFL